VSYNENLFQRIAAFLKSTKGIESKKMFGGICFMHRGNMLCGIDKERLYQNKDVEYIQREKDFIFKIHL